ncbi:MAG: hypothetical protein RQ741_05320 [Wenzhouxiangellaceae bacterium]|nr:hypothetical protein [Wenzhouxiangellaceae bacterium]
MPAAIFITQKNFLFLTRLIYQAACSCRPELDGARSGMPFPAALMRRFRDVAIPVSKRRVIYIRRAPSLRLEVRAEGDAD